MAHRVYAADELVSGDVIITGTEILVIDRVTVGTVQESGRTGERWALIYFLDGSALDFYSDATWHATVLNAPAS